MKECIVSGCLSCVFVGDHTPTDKYVECHCPDESKPQFLEFRKILDNPNFIHEQCPLVRTDILVKLNNNE